MSAMGPHRRISEMLFRRDMLGPSFGHLATSLIGILLIEKVVLDAIAPPLVPLMEPLQLAWGRAPFVAVNGALLLTVAFWGVGTLMALPALLGTRRWKIQAGKSLDRRELLRSMPLILLNYVLGIAIVPVALCVLLPDSAHDLRALPDMGTLAREAVVWLAAQEAAFYFFHRLFHVNKRLYAAIHKVHHQWTAPVSYVAIYAHPVEHVVCNLLPLVLGPVLCGSHVVAVSVFIFLYLCHTLAVHSGYWICDDNGMHDEHHAKFNVNYGILGVLDVLCGTYQLPAGAAGPAQSAKRD